MCFAYWEPLEVAPKDRSVWKWYCSVLLELKSNLGSPSGGVGENLFQLTVIFDNDSDIIYECVWVLGDQTLDRQLIHNSKQQWRARASFFDPTLGFEVYPFSLCVCVHVGMCIDLAKGCDIMGRESSVG